MTHESAPEPEMKVYLALCDRAVDPLAAGIDDALTSEFERLTTRMHQGVREALQRAYMNGVRDGFVQGVQAAAERQEGGS